jgi:5-(carboxyamino)imidazole ribonucleotide synthase
MVEEVVPFRRELSAIAVRDAAGVVAFYPLVENHHEQGVLRVSIAPAPAVAPALEASVRAAVGRLLEHLGYVGVLALEVFETATGWLANEMAPRVHNSGHWTIEGAETSQFENHLRAGLGWPLGSTAARGVSAMVNLLGDIPPHAALLSVPGARLHHYEKAARPARKLGHLTVTAPDAAALAQRLLRVAQAVPALAAPARLAAGRLDPSVAAAPAAS